MNWEFVFASLVVLAALGYLYYLIKDTRKYIDLNNSDMEAELSKTNKNLETLSKKTPRVFVNEQNEAVVTLPDGQEIDNYDLKKKK